ncbi:hypothetical protein [Pectinatus frisingensis]|uniref:hypothetical protein n=1 Tax=Pectinatus frisingensis TaxID=865 RepID=UPI003D802976
MLDAPWSITNLNKNQFGSNEDIIVAKKGISDMAKKAKHRMKQSQDKCFFCHRKVSSFCNSHSIPQFILKNIDAKGRLYTFNKTLKLPVMDNEKGINNSGTFKLICRECDSKIFSDYENPEKWGKKPSNKMLYEIAMKDYMHSISKRSFEYELYKVIDVPDITDLAHTLQQLDINEYKKEFDRSKKLYSDNSSNDEYNLFFYRKLDYIIPMAFQRCIALVVDLDGCLINDLNCKKSNYKIYNMHICAFPLKDSSVVFLFTDRKYKRYRKFIKQFTRINDLNKQLAIINYMIFMYSEDVFLSKSLDTIISNNKNLEEVARIVPSSYYGFESSSVKLLQKELTKDTMHRYTLNNYYRIPNFLSKEYAVNKDI